MFKRFLAKKSVAPEQEKSGFFSQLKRSLTKTRNTVAGLTNLFRGRKTIDAELLEELESRLLTADIGVAATNQLLEDITLRIDRKELTDATLLYETLKTDLETLLAPCEQPLLIPPQDKPFVILVVGVNGVGKTTTIGKLAKLLKDAGKTVMLAAGDTYRAAAIEQLTVWGERNQIPVIAQHNGADSASVIYDALSASCARKIDVLIADTAGRLHTQQNLMAELQKIVRVIKKQDISAPHEVLLVLDASTGQNALRQAEQFHKAVAVSGIALTKLDGTAKGGMLFAIAKELKIPIRFIGIGEAIDDLKPFTATPFVKALFSE